MAPLVSSAIIPLLLYPFDTHKAVRIRKSQHTKTQTMKQATHLFKNILLTATLGLSIGLTQTACNQKQSAEKEIVINDQLSVPALLPRKTESGPADEKAQIIKTYNDAIDGLKQNPADPKLLLKLATVYISEGRVTGNNGYYSNAAMMMLNKIIDSNPDNKDLLFESLSLKSAVLLNLHQFKDALAVAQKGQQLNAYNAGIYGALVDANVEMGNYAEAVKNCDQMLTIRPDLRSYSRASYLRQIYGDNNGAIDAMKMAVESGVPGMENTEWCRVTWGNLYFNIGKLDTARQIYETALNYRPGYPFAEIGLAKVAAAHKEYDAAINHTKNAIKVLSEAPFVSYLGELYAMKGEQEKAKGVFNDVVDLLKQNNNNSDESIVKHNGNRELALAYVDINDYETALKYAQIDYDMRPNNIDANDLMAWIYYKEGKYAEAKKYSDVIFQTKTKNANLLYKSSLIYAANGDNTTANQLKREALGITPYIDASYLPTTNN